VFSGIGCNARSIPPTAKNVRLRTNRAVVVVVQE